MHKVTTFVFAVIVTAGVGSANAFQVRDDVQADMKKLAGVWQVVKFIDRSEQPAPPEELKDHTFEFKGDTVTQRKGKNGRPLPYRIDPSKKPKWMDIDNSEGIYKIDGDTLSLCFVGGMRGGKMTPRPTEFKASKNPPYSYLVLKRVKQ